MDIIDVPNVILILLLAFSVLSFVPQIHRIMARKSSSGISTYHVLFNLSSTTEQFALAFGYVVNESDKSDFFVHRPVNAGDWINLAQMTVVFILWFILFIICLYLPSDHRDGSARFAISVYTGFFLISVLPVFIDAVEPKTPEDPWRNWPMAMFCGIHLLYLSWIITGFNVAAFYYQGKEILLRPQNQALSKLGLALQSLVFAASYPL